MSQTGTVNIKKAKMEESEKVVGGYIVLWRKDVKTACKVESVDKANKKIIYTILSGADKGKKCMSKYDPAQTVEVYDEDNVILAALNV
jgi:hypothetical protein